MNYKHLLLCAMLATAGIVSSNDHAAVVTSNAGFTVIEDFQGYDSLVTKGPQSLSNGVVITSSVYSTIGAVAVDLVDNGTWGAGNRFAGIGDLSITPSTAEGFVGTMTFDLGAASDRVGALFSIYHDGTVSGEVTIEALGAGSAVLESTTFNVNFNDFTLTNAGLFYGFVRSSSDIVALRVSGDGYVVDNLSAVPVPPALVLFASGLIGLLSRRRGAQR